MATIQGTVFMTVLAIVPPSAVLASYLLGWSVVIESSLSAKTLWALAYAVILYHGPISYFTDPLRHLPSPPNPHWLFGHSRFFLHRPPGSLPLKWMKATPNAGLIMFKGLFHIRSTLMVTTPEAVMQVLNAHSYDWQKPSVTRKILGRLLGDGLIIVEGNEHKQQRKNVTPAFSGKIIKDLVPLFWSKAWSLAEAVRRDAAANGNDTIEIGSLASRVTLDIIGSAGIGKDFSTTENANHELAQQYEMVTDPKKGNLIIYFIINLLFPPWLILKLPFKANRRAAEGCIQIRRITKELLAEKERAMKEKTVQQKDIIAVLMQSGKFTDDGLTDQLLTFLAAGHETTASALTWTTYLLAKHPEIQTRLRAEVTAASASYGPANSSAFTSDVLESMPYLEAVCSEVLRIYPTVPITARNAVRSTQILDTPVPKGTFVVISPWALNRLPALWGADADEFNPDRWMGPAGKNGGAASPYAFITFLHGPRSCIGQTFARYELKCLLAVLVMRFELALRWPDREPEPDGAVTIKPRDGMELIVKALA